MYVCMYVCVCERESVCMCVILACHFALVAIKIGYITDTRKLCMLIAFTMSAGVTLSVN